MGCTYKFKSRTGKESVFESEYELDEYIEQNYILNEILDTVYSSTNFLDNATEEQKKVIGNILNINNESAKKAAEAIKNNSKKKVDMTYDPYTEQYEDRNSNGYTSVSNKIREYLGINGKQLAPTLDEKKYITNNAKRLLEEKSVSTIKEGEEESKEILRRGEILAGAGIKIHSIAEAVFSDKNPKDIDASITDDEIAKVLPVVQNIKNKIKALKGDNVKFMCEQTVIDDNSKVIGRFDLITITDDGHVDIWDFKVSDKHYSDWNSAKKRTVDAQLATYRSLLSANGIDTSLSGLNIIPIKIDGFDPITGSFQSASLQEIDNRTTSNIKELDSKKGTMSMAINAYIKPNLPEIKISQSNSLDAIQTYTKSIFGTLGSKSEAEFIKYNLKENPAGSENRFYFYNMIPKSDGKVRKNNKIECKDIEDAKKKISEYLLKYNAYITGDRPKLLLRTLLDLKRIKNEAELNDAIKDKLKFNTYSEEIESNILNSIIHYIKSPDYKILDNVDLVNLGIFGFINTTNNTIDFVTLTNSDVTNKIMYNIKDATTVLGSKYSDYSIDNKLKYKNILKANIGNAKLLEVLFAVNEVFKDVANFKIGSIEVLNTNNNRMYNENIDKLKHNFDVLCTEFNITNNLTGNVIEDQVIVFKDKMLALFSGDIEFGKITSKFGKYFESTTLKSKIKALEDIKYMIKNAYPNSNFNLSNTEFKSKEVILYAKISKLISDLVHADVNKSNDISDLAFNLTNISKTLGVSGALLSNPSEIDNPAYSKVVELVIKTIDATHKEFLKFKKDSMDRNIKLYESKGLGKLQRYTVKVATFAYQNLFVRNADGTLDSRFMVKNPYDSNEILTNEEREYLKSFLFEINKYRLNLEEGLTPDSAIFDDVVDRAIQSGVYFEIPLIKGDIFSKFKNNKLGGVIKDAVNDQINLLNITEEDREIVRKQQKEVEYASMVNQFNLSNTQRTSRLNEYGAGYFETNLEIIESMYVLAAIKKNNFDPTLKIIKSIRNALNYSSYMRKEDVSTLSEFIEKYIKVVVFKESGMSKSHEKVYKTLNPLVSTVRAAKLAFSVNGLVREPVMGFINMATRAMTRTYGKDSFTNSDLMQAYKIFMTKFHGTFGDGMNLLEGISMFYRMSNADSASFATTWNTGNKGLAQFEKIKYLGATASDFLNRNVFMLAQMIHDGTYEAHYMDGFELKYDFNKDKRFTEFVKGNVNSPNYNKQKNEYTKLYLEMKREYELKNEIFDLKFGDALPKAYTDGEAKSIRAGADSIFGYYNTEDKMLIKNTLFGAFMFQFKTHLSAVKERYAKGGGKDAFKGEWVQKHNEKGEKLYYKYIVSENNEMEIIETTEETDHPAQEWTGRFTEGMINSAFKVGQYLCDKYLLGKDVELEYSETRKANTEQLAINMFLHALIAFILAMIVKDDEELSKNFFVRNVARGAVDDSPVAFLDATLDASSATYDTISNIYGYFQNFATSLNVPEFVKNMAYESILVRNISNVAFQD